MQLEEPRLLFPNPQEALDRRILDELRRKYQLSTEEIKTANKLCGFPSFCLGSSYHSCNAVALQHCKECSMSLVGVLASIYILLGVLIVFGNGVVVRNFFSKRKNFQDFYSKIRGSLAIADILTGVIIFVVILPNLLRTISKTPFEINEHQLLMEGSLQAIAGGFFYILGFTSSLYHLVFLSMQRLYAIKFPMKYKVQNQNSIFTGLITVWVLASLSSIFPVWFPKTLTFTYHPNLFLYLPSKIAPSYNFTSPTASYPNINYDGEIAVLFIFVVIPYILVTIMSIMLGVCFYNYNRTSFHRLTANSKRKTNNNLHKREKKLYKTIFYMQLGFVISLMPMIVAFVLIFVDVLNCESRSTPLLICMILSTSSSFINVLIYAGTDKKFRNSIYEIFKVKSITIASKNSGSKSIKTISSSSKAISTNVQSLTGCFQFQHKLNST